MRVRTGKCQGAMAENRFPAMRGGEWVFSDSGEEGAAALLRAEAMAEQLKESSMRRHFPCLRQISLTSPQAP